METVAQSHVLMHPALHEEFGNVWPDASPAVCLDIGRPASQDRPESGCAAPARMPAEAVTAMVAFLEQIHAIT
jgi:hypothetical protein